MKLPKPPAEDQAKKTFREKMFDMTPIVLTVMATLLAGLSSSEMTRSQYFRALAAQGQSKASDQWNYYQVKRQRAVNAQDSLELLHVAARPQPPGTKSLVTASRQLVEQFATADPKDEGSQVLHEHAAELDKELNSLLNQSHIEDAFFSIDFRLPAASDTPITDSSILAAMGAVEQNQTEQQMTSVVRAISEQQVTSALQTVRANLDTFIAAVQPMSSALDRLSALIDEETEIGAGFFTADSAVQNIQSAQAAVAAARFRFAAARYDKEANFNRLTGQILEVQVHRAGIESDRHRSRSNGFFEGMLVAQAGVLISSLSLAVRQRSAFWTLAAVAGAGAAAFGSYVFMFQ